MGKVKCLECGEILESVHRHDFQSCECVNKTFVDGGNDYLRCGGMDRDKVQVFGDSIYLIIFHKDHTKDV